LEDRQSHIIRQAIFEWLGQQVAIHGHVLGWQTLAKGFTYQDETIPLIGAKGIWKPKYLSFLIISRLNNYFYISGLIK